MKNKKIINSEDLFHPQAAKQGKYGKGLPSKSGQKAGLGERFSPRV
jgi:hypothetical protein